MASPQSALSSSSFFPMPDASYQWISASRIVPLGSLTLAYPLRFRHRPGPYIFRRRGSSRIEPPAANVSAPAISPQTSKNTPSAFYHLSGREHPGGNTMDVAAAGISGGGGGLLEAWLGRRDSNPDTQIQSLQSYR